MVLGQNGASSIPHRQTDFEYRATQLLRSTRNAISPGGRPRRPLSWTLPHQHQCSKDDQVKEDSFTADVLVHLTVEIITMIITMIIIDHQHDYYWSSPWLLLIITMIIIDHHHDYRWSSPHSRGGRELVQAQRHQRARGTSFWRSRLKLKWSKLLIKMMTKKAKTMMTYGEFCAKK